MTEHAPQPASPPGDLAEKLIEQSAMGILFADEALRVTFANAAALETLDLEADPAGQPLAALLDPEEPEVIKKLLRSALAHHSSPQTQISRTVGDEQRELVACIAPLRDESDRAVGVAAWIFDDTEARVLGERLAQAEKMASLGTLAGGVAHHFNNILGGVATFVDFALTSGSVADMKRALQMTAEAAARASRITQSLLSFTKSEPPHPDLADLTEVVLTFSHLVEKPLEERHIDLKLDLQPVPIVPVEANCMHQVLGHLLTNAEEAMPSGGTVTLALRKLEEEVELAFSDTGVGIEPENLSQVFEPFFTTKGLLAGGDRGNPGLGLSIVHGKVLELGGQIEVASRPDEGSTFRVRLPIPDPDD